MTHPHPQNGHSPLPTHGVSALTSLIPNFCPHIRGIEMDISRTWKSSRSPRFCHERSAEREGGGTLEGCTDKSLVAGLEAMSIKAEQRVVKLLYGLSPESFYAASGNQHITCHKTLCSDCLSGSPVVSHQHADHGQSHLYVLNEYASFTKQNNISLTLIPMRI